VVYGELTDIMDLQDALDLAVASDLDLVLVVPDADPPVARIVDLSKRRFEASKQRQVSMKSKTVSLNVRIARNDLNTKLRTVSRLLEKGHEVRVTVMLRRRENSHPELAHALLAEVVASVANAKASELKQTGNIFSVSLRRS